MGLVYASDDKVLHLRAGAGPSVDVQSNGNVIAPNYLEAKDDIHSGRNISSVGLIQAGRACTTRQEYGCTRPITHRHNRI